MSMSIRDQVELIHGELHGDSDICVNVEKVVMPLTYPQMKQKLRALLGSNADGRGRSILPGSVADHYFELGVFEKGVFKAIAGGNSWDEAWENLVKLVKKAQGKKK